MLLSLHHFESFKTPLYRLSDNEIDGEAFLELTIEKLNVLISSKLGIVKKIYHLIQSVSSYSVIGIA